MAWPWIIAAVGAAASYAGRSAQASAQRENQQRQEEAIRKREEFERREKERVATYNHRTQVLQLLQNYNDQIRSREWNYMQATTQWIQREGKAKLEQNKLQYQYLIAEVNRRGEWREQYYRNEFEELRKQDASLKRAFENERENIAGQRQSDNQLTQFLLSQKREESGIEQQNWEARQAYELAEQQRILNQAAEDNRFAIQNMRNDLIDVIAESRYNIAVGNVSAQVAVAETKAAGDLRDADRKKLQEQGMLLSMGQAGNSVVRLLGDAERRSLSEKQQATMALGEQMGAAKVAYAEAEIQRAAAMLSKQFTAKRTWIKAAEPFQKTFVPGVAPPKYIPMPATPGYTRGPELPGFRAAPAPPDRIPTVAPIRGPRPQEPDYPSKPIVGVQPKTYVPKAPTSNPFLDILGAGLQGLEIYGGIKDLL